MGAEAARHPGVIPALLISLCDDPSTAVRSSAADALGAMGPEAARHPEVFPGLLRLLCDDAPNSWSAVDALVAIGVLAVQHSALIPTLLRLLRNAPDEKVRWKAADVLGEMEKLGVRIFNGSVRWVKDLARE
jgi:HEAT repeat protein